MKKIEVLFAAAIMFVVGVFLGSTLKDARAQRSDLPQRVQTQEQPPIATWWMHVGADSVGRVQVNVPALCKAFYGAPRE